MTRIKISEADFQDAVVEVAHLYRWHVSHFGRARTKDGWSTPVRYDGKGFPDCVFVHPDGGVLFVEFKAERGRLSKDQAAWGAWLDDAGADYCLWRPGNADIIMGILSHSKVTKWNLQQKAKI